MLLMCALLGVGPHAEAAAPAPDAPRELHAHLRLSGPDDRRVALTLDACSGGYDADLIEFLIRNRIPATIFATGRWIRENPAGIATLKAHLDLFDIEDHGAEHIPAVIGARRRVYGIPGEPDIVHLRHEVDAGAREVAAATGVAPHWYRGATAVYDQAAADEIRRMGYQIAGFSVNADQGATASRAAIERRMAQVRPGDIIIAHMNKPSSQTAEALRPSLLALLRRGLRFVRLDGAEVVQESGG